jgi:hypothetical protein
MALALTTRLNTKLLDSTSGTVSVTTPSPFTPSDSSLLVVVVGLLGLHSPGGDVPATASSTLSGGSLTWTKRVSGNTGDIDTFYGGLHEIWTAPVTTGASMTLTWANSGDQIGASDATRVALQVFDLTGYDTSTPTGGTASDTTLGTSGSGPLTLSGAPASDSVVIASRYINQNGTTNITATAGSGWSEIYDHDAVSGSEGYACLETQQRTGSTSTSVSWVEINANAQAVFGEAIGLALEIKAAAVGGDEEDALSGSASTAGHGTASPVFSIGL